MEDKKAKLYEALENIQDEKSLDRILNFVKEEATSYRAHNTEILLENLPVWQQVCIKQGLKEIENGKTHSWQDVLEKMRDLR